MRSDNSKIDYRSLTDDEIASKARAMLARFYGYSSFRPLQQDVIIRAMRRLDSVVLMPTGGGKSVCYQIPALLSSGVVIVVSPLIALMHDQVAALISNGIPAATVNSLQSDEDNREIMEQLYTGRIRVLYISPERLLLEMERWNSDLDIALFAIDEAHCISQWGHDFRPGYTRLSRIKELFPHVPVMALTATADRLTREDIAAQLCLEDPRLFIGSFDRPNISINVQVNPGKSRRLRQISDIIDRHRGDSGIVYCMSRKGAEDMDKQLRDRGYRSVVYHAGLTAAERTEAQRRFINGDVQVVCATVAFGMGIDKSNIRWVVHNNMPRNIECYYQEIGRAGRDGASAEAVMFYSYADIATLQSFVDDSGQQALNSEKLQRMKEFAESSLCRRRVLLSYFNEILDHDCGNCDVCLSPPERIDGTVIALKAMSAIVRTGENVGITMLIDILRGASRQELVQRGYDRIKTYGAGRDMSFAQWNGYISQLIQLGLIEIAYNEGNHLKLTAYGRKVLADRSEVTLARYIPFESRGKRSSAKVTEPQLTPAQRLMEILKEVRLKLARKEAVPPYLVLSDKVIQELVRFEPVDMESFSRVEGIGERKTVRYWRPFVTAIRRFKGMDVKLGNGMSQEETLLLLNSGYDVAAIAEAKGIKTATVYQHLTELVNADKLTDFSTVITREQYLRAMNVAKSNPTEYYEILGNEMPSGLPRLALAISDFLLRHKTD